MRFIAIAVILFLGLASPAWADARDDLEEGILARLTGATFDAIMLFTRAIEDGGLSPEEQADAHFYRAEMYQAEGLDESAIADYRKALQLDPDRRLAREALRGLGASP